VAAAVVIVGGFLLLSQDVRGTRSLPATDAARLAMVQQAISNLDRGDRPVCLGIWEQERDARPRNPSPRLLEGLSHLGRVVPITECVDDDEESGQRPQAVFMEALAIDWEGDQAASMTIETWSSDSPVTSTVWTAHRMAGDLWEASTASLASDEAEPDSAS
jgi:hypothetical protein